MQKKGGGTHKGFFHSEPSWQKLSEIHCQDNSEDFVVEAYHS